jgi:heterodisulfide reductase subunit C
MSVVVQKGIDKTFLEELASIPGGEGVKLCIQCGTCSGSCPNANEMDYAPRQMIALVRAGMRDEALSSNSMWYCASCYLCTVRCPREIKITELMHALECLAIRHGMDTKRTRTPLMYRTFVDSIRSNGRVHEFGFMVRYYIRAMRFYLPSRANPLNPLRVLELFGMLPVGLGLYSHGRLALRPTKVKGMKGLKAIIDKAEAIDKAQAIGGDH